MSAEVRAPDKQRLFFALRPDAGTRAALARVAGNIPKDQGRAVNIDNLHITLSFIGEVDGERRACLEQAAAGAAIVPFTLSLDRLGYFAKTRVVWLGASSTPPELTEAVKSLNRALRRCGHKPERRPFVPHVTLARKARPLRESIEFEPVRWEVNRFSLMQSVPEAGGVRYHELREYVYES
jgi:2'-5' RNA ligase